MLETNAILAINSLDRYITGIVVNTSIFAAYWANDVYELTFIPLYSVSTPIVGASIYDTAGILSGTKITAFDPVTLQITIDTKTIAAISPPSGEVVLQEESVSAASQPVPNVLYSLFNNVPPYSNDFSIQSPGALIYGYITKIVVSQVSIQYNTPTITTRNSILAIQKAGQGQISFIDIPYGFYYGSELAALMEVQLANDDIMKDLGIQVVYSSVSGFTFTAKTGGPTGFFFPNIPQLQIYLANHREISQLTIILKTYSVFGISVFNTTPAREQASTLDPVFLYTPYIDICSNALTNYQKVKDTTTSATKVSSLIARVYLAGSGQVQTTTSVDSLGCRPFQVVADLNSPKVIRWTPDVAVPSLDFKVYDQYSDLIPTSQEVLDPVTATLVGEGSNTEFQITLLCIEGERN